MRTEELLALGLFGRGSRLSDRIETLLKGNREFSPQASMVRVGLSAGALLAMVIAGSLVPRWIAFAQPQAHLQFEVTSVRPDKEDPRRLRQMQFLPSGRFNATNIPLQAVIARAYNITYSAQLTGGPDWVRSDRFDIEATALIPTGLSDTAREERMRLLLRSLLQDRFKLTIRSETKELPVYAVVKSKQGPKLQKAKIDEKDCPESATSGADCHQFVGGQGRGLHGKAVDMSDLALFVSNWTDRPVIDKTGIKGLFEIESQPWQPFIPGPAPDSGAKSEDGSELGGLPTLFTVFDQLGLKLEPQRAPLETFVIEHVEKPNEN